ncbi:hypothetical protein WJX75_000066 [Coccomyxa subellipsoidea]|uniref:Phospholipid/glycerol acyltransferase domain-containing protein n=1 Tax=Coccomyxa subellipsoidea TaxID=248742 RepID=A0ABR2YXW9_9CHLO
MSVQLLNPVATDKLGRLPPLVYCPGSDGTGNSIAPQLPGLTAAGFDVRCLYIPPSDRSGWDELTRQVVALLRHLIQESSVSTQVTLVAESYGGCLGLRVAVAAPDLIQRLVLVNPATSFSRALSGLPSIIASTNLLSLFPAPLYQVAQAVLPENGFVNVEEQMSQQSRAVARGLQLYEPAVTASWRLRMLRKGNVGDADLMRIRAPTLIVASAADRLLPSLEESGRLVGKIPDARRVILPNSGHTALLESGISLAEIMGRTGFLPAEAQSQEVPVTALNGAAAASAEPASGFKDSADAVDTAVNVFSGSISGNGTQNGAQTSIMDAPLAEGAASVGPTRKDTIDANYEEALRLLDPFRNLVAPVVRGAENVPDGAVSDRACLFVGNHTLFGLYDLPFLMYELYLRGHKVRGLAHRAHWNGPTGRLFERFGAVPASPRAAYKLLKQGESVLLFPGGGREVNKLKGQQHQLQWKEQPDFVRMAAKLNAIIIPFAAVGGDDAFDIALDTREVLANSILGPLARGALERVAPGLDPDEAIPPITRGLFGLPSPLAVPKLERIYFRFMAPIDPNNEMCSIDDEDACMSAYGKVRGSVEAGIQQLLAEREVDPERDLGPRLLGQAARFLPAFELLSPGGGGR